MTRRSALSALASLGAALALSFLPRVTSAQQLGEGMDRGGSLDIRNEAERAAFGDLQCTCGCPRESLATCTCSFAGGFRSEVRGMMARGMTREEIKADWVRQHGLQALTVPANTGANRLLYIAPLLAIVAMGAFAITMLRRFRRKSDANDANAKARANAGAAPVAAGKRDEYDDKLDDELRRLDDG